MKYKMSFSHRWEKQEEKKLKKRKIKKKSRGRWGAMATTSGGSVAVRPLFVMVGLVERQAMVVFGCKESVRKSREIFLVHALQLFYFLDVINFFF